jgi:hypothetical protein
LADLYLARHSVDRAEDPLAIRRLAEDRDRLQSAQLPLSLEVGLKGSLSSIRILTPRLSG